MRKINFDKEWTFRRGFLDSVGMLADDPGVLVNLPHDGMISTRVSEDAKAGYDWGYFNGDKNNYTKFFYVPEEWKNEKVGLKFDGAMMHTTIDINGCKVGEHHYGYSPFYVDISDYVSYGENNRITVNTNTGVEPSCRWYTGSGLYRSVSLCHSPLVHIKNDGIFVYTKEVDGDVAYLEALVEVCNETLENRIAEINVTLLKDGSNEVETFATRTIVVNSGKEETARIAIILKNPMLWDSDNPNLYNVKVTATDTGVFRTHFIPNENCSVDEDEILFGVKTITADAIRGLRINGKTVKLKGGCVHHDNGLLGAVSLYESEARKIKKLKEIGFNAIRTAHNPPSAALVEACDRLGMYIFDEAFDSWGMAKRPGDFSNHFSELWEQELTSFVRRDRSHPSVIMWSTGNEIPERGGLNQGYSRATKLAECIRKLDGTRPISNGICSFWSGLDDFLAKNQSQIQNAQNSDKLSWEKITEPFTNGLDIVGYNYMEGQYEKDHEMFPERVILGSENFPREIGFRWPVVEKLPYVIGDFTWTAWDYIGEAGIGKSLFVAPDDPLVERGPWAIMPPSTTFYPWRLANDADFDITGKKLPQGYYRSVIWGNKETHLFSQHPKYYGMTEVIGMWGFTNVEKNWNFAEYEDKPIELVVFTAADEVELRINNEVIERKTVEKFGQLPCSVRFRTIYKTGKVEAISYVDGKEVSRDAMETAKPAIGLRLTSEKFEIMANGNDLAYVEVDVVDEDNNLVPDAEFVLRVAVEGSGILAGFGTGNPITEEVYSDDETTTFRGHATAIVRGGYEPGTIVLTVECETLSCTESVDITVL